MSDIVVCPKCRARMISEEMLGHSCGPIYKIEDNVLWIRSRGGTWNRHIIPQSVFKRLEAEGLEYRSHHPKMNTPRNHPMIEQNHWF